MYNIYVYLREFVSIFILVTQQLVCALLLLETLILVSFIFLPFICVRLIFLHIMYHIIFLFSLDDLSRPRKRTRRLSINLSTCRKLVAGRNVTYCRPFA